MPIYEYLCGACGHRFEQLEPPPTVSEKPSVTCPSCCGTGALRQWSRISVGTGRKAYHRAEPLDV
jgi:putative FmdB family regulatory protein